MGSLLNNFKYPDLMESQKLAFKLETFGCLLTANMMRSKNNFVLGDKLLKLNNKNEQYEFLSACH